MSLRNGFRENSVRRRRRSGQGIGKWRKFGSDFGRGGFGFARQRSEPGWNLDLFDSERGRREVANWGSRLDFRRRRGLHVGVCDLQKFIGNLWQRNRWFRGGRRNRSRRPGSGSFGEEKRSQLFLKARGLLLQLIAGRFARRCGNCTLRRLRGRWLNSWNGRSVEERRNGGREIGRGA